MASQSQELEEVKCLTAKKLAKPEFAKNPEKFYPVNTLKKWGFHRAQCPQCGEHFWRHTEKKTVCGDSKCESRYHFIGKKTGIGKTQHVSYSDAWNGFKKSFETAKIPHTAIARYPVVARWRDDVDFVAAGIFCFQPYCVTGELDPPANPLVCPQFCLRFNDLDNIGLSGRHYSGFVMLGIQVFNKPDNFVYFKEECVDFNLRWLTEELKIDLDEITLIEDVWAGGGNLGPSIEYFIGGLELGNMVFMQYKTFPDGSREELKVQVIDVGIGLERVPWLLNGENTSYITVFKHSLEFLQKKLGISVTNEGWEKFGPYSCLLNMDEVDDIDQTWNSIAQKCEMTKEDLVKMIKPVQEIFVIADHTRTALMAIEDGCLPAHSGGASNVRNIVRRVFAILERNDWWSKIGGLDGLLELFEQHRLDLAQLYGAFKPYSSFPNIIAIEYERWQSTEAEAKQKLMDLVKKRPNGQLTIDDWISSIQGLGIDADRISQLTNQPVPGNLYLTLAEKQETTVRVHAKQPYDTVDLPPTEELFYKSESQLFDFDSKIVKVIKNVDTNRNDIVVLQQTCFYPLAGGQDHDIGKLTVKGKTFDVVNVQKVGKCVLHYLSEGLPEDPTKYQGEIATGKVDRDRRLQLRNHHTATHIVFAAARRVLGPHVWQHGAKKTMKYAHIDITHYKSLTFEDELAIENEANRIVQSCTDIHKYGMAKEDAEKKYGFALYQGGVVAGSVLRVVEILGVDHEACCGTHADNTAQVGSIKILNTNRISDGIVRIKFVAGEKALEEHNHSAKIMHDVCSMWNVLPDDLVGTASRFFQAYKQNGAKLKKQTIQIIEFQVKLFLSEPEPALLIQSDEPTATVFISTLPVFAEELKKSGKSVVALGSNWVYGVLGKEGLNIKELQQAIVEAQLSRSQRKTDNTNVTPEAVKVITKSSVSFKKDKKPVKVEGVTEIMVNVNRPLSSVQTLIQFFKSNGYKAL